MIRVLTALAAALMLCACSTASDPNPHFSVDDAMAYLHAPAGVPAPKLVEVPYSIDGHANDHAADQLMGVITIRADLPPAMREVTIIHEVAEWIAFYAASKAGARITPEIHDHLECIGADAGIGYAEAKGWLGLIRWEQIAAKEYGCDVGGPL